MCSVIDENDSPDMFVISQDISKTEGFGYPDKSSSVSTAYVSDASYHPTQSQSQVSDSSESSDFLDDEPTGLWLPYSWI